MPPIIDKLSDEFINACIAYGYSKVNTETIGNRIFAKAYFNPNNPPPFKGGLLDIATQFKMGIFGSRQEDHDRVVLEWNPIGIGYLPPKKLRKIKVK